MGGYKHVQSVNLYLNVLKTDFFYNESGWGGVCRLSIGRVFRGVHITDCMIHGSHAASVKK